MDDGVIYIDGVRMFKHILFLCENGVKTVQGFLLSSVPEMNAERQDIMFVADNDPILHTVNEGWRLDSGGHWLQPETTVKVTATNLEGDIAEIKHQLSLLRDYEETAAWLGVAPYSKECDAVLPNPVYYKPEVLQAPKHNNLFEAFQSLVQDEARPVQDKIQGIPNAGVLSTSVGVQQLSPVVKSSTTAVISAPTTVSTPIPSKSELLSLLADKCRQLAVN